MRPIDADWLVQKIEGWQDQLAETYGQNDEYVICLGEVLMKIDDAPTIADLPQKWIPCSERLPDVSGRYLVTRGLKAAGAIWNRVYVANFSDLMGLKSNMIFWQGNVGKSDFEKLEDVLAWMPLPEPWKGGED